MLSILSNIGCVYLNCTNSFKLSIWNACPKLLFDLLELRSSVKRDSENVRQKLQDPDCKLKAFEILRSDQTFRRPIIFILVPFSTSLNAVSVRSSRAPLGPIYTVRLSRMRQAYDRPTT